MKFSNATLRKIVHLTAMVSKPFPVLLKTPFFSFVLLLIVISNTMAVSQVLNTKMPTINGGVKAMAQSGDTLYLGGSFTCIGEPTGRAILLDKSTAQHDKTFPAIDGYVNVVVSDGAGGWYIGGKFTKVNGVPRNSIVRINADNSISPWFPSLTTINAQGVEVAADVQSIALKGNMVFIGGFFTKVNGITRNYVAAVDTIGAGGLLDWDPKVNSIVFSIQPSDSTVFIGGAFTTVLDGLVPKTFIAEIKLSTGWPTTWNPTIHAPGSLAPVRGMLLDNDTLFVWGSWVSINTIDRNGLAALDAKTGSVTDWDPLAYSTQYELSKSWFPVSDLKIKGDTVYLAGTFINLLDFNTGNVLPRNHLAAVSKSVRTTPYGDFPLLFDWNPDVEGNETAMMNPSVKVASIYLDGNNLYAAGTFSSVGQTEHQNIASIDLNTGLVNNFDAKLATTDGTYLPGLNAICMNGNKVLAGGWINIINSVKRNSAAAVKISTGEILPWDPKCSYSDSTYPYSTINDIVKFQNEIYIAGAFNQVANQSRSGLIAVDPDSAKLFPYNLNTEPGGIQSLGIADNKLYLAGSLSYFGDSTRRALASYDLINHSVTGWNPDNYQSYSSYYGTIYSMAFHDSLVYVSGTFGALGDSVRNQLGAVNIYTGEASSWNPHQNNSVGAKIRSLAYSNGKVFVGGGYTSMAYKTGAYFIAADSKTGDILPLAYPQINTFHGGDGIPGIYCLTVKDSILYMGGAITGVGGLSTHAMAALNTNTLDVLPNFNPQLTYIAGGGGTIVNKIYLDNKNNLYFGGNFRNVNDQPYSGFASYSGVLTEIKNENPLDAPTSYSLAQNYPNPFNPATQIRFSLPEASPVKLTIYDVLGKQVAVLVNDNLSAGTHTYNFNAANFASGVYFYRIEANNFNMVKKMMLLK